ncbi:MAG: helix-turn-helix transcriptional regulator [Clostridia bacterium]|nr:helix-turn-helix transcriptional regulator [Clostridia bacterium]
MNHYTDMPQPDACNRPIRVYRVTASDADAAAPLQSHTEHEILCVVQGEMTLHINNTTYEAGAGNMFWIQSGALVTTENLSANCIYYYMLVDLRAIVAHEAPFADYCDRLDDNTCRIDAFLGHNPLPLREMFDKIVRCSKAPLSIGTEMEMRGLIMQFVGRILQDGRWHTTEQMADTDIRAQRAVRRVLALIEENYAQELTLTDMANAAELSPNYFCRYFKKIAGCSPVEYLIEYRLNMAAYMLTTTEDGVADVALACGFNDASHFIKFFHRYKGVTPRRYRQLNAKQAQVD